MDLDSFNGLHTGERGLLTTPHIGVPAAFRRQQESPHYLIITTFSPLLLWTLGIPFPTHRHLLLHFFSTTTTNAFWRRKTLFQVTSRHYFLPGMTPPNTPSTQQPPLLRSSRCPRQLRFSVLAKRIQLLGYSTGDLLQSGLWDTDHKPLGPVLQTILRPPHWALTQSGRA